VKTQTFTADRGRVLLSGIELSDHRIDDLLDLFQKEAREADRAADEARRAYNRLEDARCLAMDYRHDKRSRAA
jgi:hypothetical protein